MKQASNNQAFTPEVLLSGAGSSAGEGDIRAWLDYYFTDEKARNLTPGTIRHNRGALGLFVRFCESRAISNIGQITPQEIRLFLLWLEENRHNPGGLQVCFRALRAFLRWYEAEEEPEGWKNPITKVKPPKVPVEPIQGVEPQEVNRLLKALGDNWTGRRDRAIILALFDTGCRASEFVGLNREDVSPISGEILIRVGKGRKPRVTFIGKATRRALRAYLKTRTDNQTALWVNTRGERLTYAGLAQLLERRGRAAGLQNPPSPHDFRRGCALALLRNGADIITVQRILGHSDLSVLHRYLAQTTGDLQENHLRAGPVDNLFTRG